MKLIIITNNPKVYEKYEGSIKIEYMENKSHFDVLKYTRDKIHMGHKLLSHPLSGSVKPNETPYKSILISEKKGKIDINGLNLIENSISTYEKFQNISKIPDWNEQVLYDFMVVDLSLIENTLKNVEFTEIFD
ncbi:MAG TPA: GrdX family protein [Soehngenia sp.]|jgi:hypothetical protein|nr:GrdX family protein [Soehngenia sp.]HPP30903.1 GrdX family protein [Soehngenia sp.]